ncbi:MAG: hypothetical protein COB67_07900 [SAR324 cluster bacterium]|uniref:Uncharacterized protein n=1 Tax=SAR324 cluster bacterium TaxID=2024889 RepID=A0A2A4T343_9DELT|nr:MAG: hypothetical protein COB67_07900 [SAR324 cluster bacterium]
MVKLTPRFFGWTAIFLSTALVLVVLTQLIRQSKPQEIDSGWRYQVAVTLDQAGDLYHAIEELQAALKEEDSREDAQKLLAAIENRKRKAPEILAQIAEKIGDDGLKFKRGKLYLARGIVKELQNKDLEAIQSFKTSLELKSRQSLAMVRLGLAYERIGQLETADAYFQQALEKNDPALLTHFHYGLFLQRTFQNKEKAEEMAQFVESARPLYAKIIREKI